MTVNRIAKSAIVRDLRAAGCVFAEQEAQMLIAQANSYENLAAMLEKRIAGAPLEQVVGWRSSAAGTSRA